MTYNEQAERLELRLRDAVPLIEWRVMQDEDMAWHWRVLNMQYYTDYEIRARIKINDQWLYMQMRLDRILLEDAMIDAVAYITQTISSQMADKIRNWRPEE